MIALARPYGECRFIRSIKQLVRIHSYKNKKYNIGNIFKHIYNKLYPELEKIYGFRIVKVENAEADDIIAVLANKIYNQDKNRLIVIISNDNDYLQLVNDKTLIWSLQNKLLNSKWRLHQRKC